jgi:molecular chaperone GrpE
VIALANWFNKKSRAEQPDQADPADSTVEVKAHVIADAIRAGQVQQMIGQPIAGHPRPPQQTQPQQTPPPQQQAQPAAQTQQQTYAQQPAPQAQEAPQGTAEPEAAVTEPQPEQPVAVDQPDTDVTATLLDQALTERRTLVQLCLYALDRARSAGVTERIEEALATVGVTALRPDGDKFDPTLHEAGGTVDTENAELDGTVAETEVVGFSDRGTTLRVPIVTVYTAKNAPQTDMQGATT